jgi:hypothetical protein
MIGNPKPLNPGMGQSYANLEGLGMTLVKPFGILVEGWGEGVSPDGIAEIARKRRGSERTKPHH